MKAITVAISLLSASVSMAQTDTLSVSHNLQGVEVTAVSMRSPLRKATPGYEVAAKDFARLNVTDMTSALRRLPGITLRDYGGAGGMKTISVRGLGSQHTAVAIDGVVTPDMAGGQIDLSQFNISEISGITLSVVGNDDIFMPARNLSKASLLNMETRADKGFHAQVGTGSWGLITSAASFAKENSHSAYSVKGGFQRADNNYPFIIHNGADTHVERRQNSELTQGYANGMAKWSFNDNTQVALAARLSDTFRELPGLVRYYVNENFETLRNQTATVHGKMTTKLSAKLSLRADMKWDFAKQDYVNDKPNLGINSERYLSREWYATVGAKYDFTRNIALSYSADFSHQAMSTTLKANPEPRRNSLLQAIAAKWMMENMSITATLLRSDIDSEHRTSPSLSAVWKPFRQKPLYIRLNAKSIFRMPTMTELYYFHFGSQDLKPENTQQLNIGLTWRTVENSPSPLAIDASVNAYINKVTDKIVGVPYNMFVWRFMNLSTVNGRGVDAVLNMRYAVSEKHSLSLTANGSVQSINNVPLNKDYRPMQIAYVPLLSGNAVLAWQNPWFGTSVSAMMASETWTTNEHHDETWIAPYADMSASVYRSFKLKHALVSVKLVVENLLDYDYEIVARYPMPGRNWKVGVNIKW